MEPRTRTFGEGQAPHPSELGDPPTDLQRPEPPPAVTGGKGQPRWHRAGITLYPSDRTRFEQEFERLVRESLVAGHAPAAPLLGEADTVVTLGGCFATDLRRCLPDDGFDPKRHWLPGHLNNTFAMLDFATWCVTGEDAGRGVRFDRLDQGQIYEWVPEHEHAFYEARFREAGAFFLAIGIAEVWEDRVGGGVFWRAVPEDVYDEGRHVLRVSTVEENAANIRGVVDLIRRVNADAPIVLALSPVPLAGTFRGFSCVSADCVSKSVLRVAIDQVMADGRRGVYYWPSFEIVRWSGAHLPWPAYGLDDNKAHHPSLRLVAEVADAFVESYYPPEAVEAIRARAAEADRRRTRPKKPRSLAKRLRKLRRRKLKALRARARAPRAG